MLPLLIVLVGLVVAAVGGLLPSVPTVIVGTVLSAFGAVWQYRDSRPFVLAFSTDSWVPDGPEGYGHTILVPARQHHHGKNVTVTVYAKTGPSYEVVLGDVQADCDGQLTLHIAAPPFVGKLVVN